MVAVPDGSARCALALDDAEGDEVGPAAEQPLARRATPRRATTARRR
jgi:hypothetical protein